MIGSFRQSKIILVKCQSEDDGKCHNIGKQCKINKEKRVNFVWIQNNYSKNYVNIFLDYLQRFY